ncbi:ATP-binding protein [soil metagenome]
MSPVRTIDVVGTALLLLVGVFLGASALLLTQRLGRSSTDAAGPQRPATTAGNPAADTEAVSPPAVPAGVTEVLAVLSASAFVVQPGGTVVEGSRAACELGLVRGDRVVLPELTDLIRATRRDGQIRDRQLVLSSGRASTAARHVSARVALLDDTAGQSLVLVLVDDRTRERRVEAVRRDFTVNVSHELKTPVGALTLLAEAVDEAADDPEAVSRFAQRMRVEAERLGRLVQQVIELSRLQDDELLDEPQRVDVDVMVAAALDRTRIDAEARRVALVGQRKTGLAVRGNAGRLQVALGNLVDNAVVYSPGDTRVTVTVKTTGDKVHITVSDQGIGIAEAELERIFERFYRVDPARARATGGTGLGLSIVKHIAASHGGEVRVWSVERTGSSFTLVLPAWTEPAGGEDSETSRESSTTANLQEAPS